MNMTKETRKEALKYRKILLGILLCTMAYNMFLIPNDLARVEKAIREYYGMKEEKK